MVATTAFVLGFVLIGLAVLFVAMQGGARGAREALHSRTPAGRMITASAIAGVAAIFGVGIPALVLAQNKGPQRESARGGVELNESQIRGRALFAGNCSSCHVLEAAGASGRVGPDLDELRPPEALVLNAIELGRARGLGQMPAELLDGQEAKDVASFVAATAGR